MSVRCHLCVCVLWQETGDIDMILAPLFLVPKSNLCHFFFSQVSIFQIVVFCSVSVSGYVMVVVDK